MNNDIDIQSAKETVDLRGGSRLAYGALILAVAAVSFAAVLVRLTDVSPIAVAFYRLFFSAVVLVPVCCSEVRRYRREGQLTAQGKNFALAALSGVFLALHYYTWFQSLRLTTVASSTVLVTLHPFFVLGISWLLWREPVSPKLIAALAVTLVGGYIIGSQDLQASQQYLVGDLLALVAAGFMAGYLLLGQVVRRELSLGLYVTIVYGVGALVAALIMALGQVPFFGYSLWDYLILLALALGPNLLGHTLFNWSLAYLPVSVVSVSVLAEPVGAVILAMIFLHEIPTGAQLLGGLIIFWGIGWFVLEKNRLQRGRQVRE